jgi:hypothetical protein
MVLEAVQRTESQSSIRPVFIGLLAGFGPGVLNAIVARILMRVIALLMFGKGSFSMGAQP